MDKMAAFCPKWFGFVGQSVRSLGLKKNFSHEIYTHLPRIIQNQP